MFRAQSVPPERKNFTCYIVSTHKLFRWNTKTIQLLELLIFPEGHIINREAELSVGLMQQSHSLLNVPYACAKASAQAHGKGNAKIVTDVLSRRDILWVERRLTKYVMFRRNILCVLLLRRCVTAINYYPSPSALLYFSSRSSQP